MTWRYLFAMLSFSVLTEINAQSLSQEAQSIQVDVTYLASNVLQGRAAGTEGAELAARYIADQFAEIGLSSLEDTEGYFQSFEFENFMAPSTPEGQLINGKNIIGWMNNDAPTTVIISAHYDHIGDGKFGSKDPNNPGIHNGADDNASGIGALLQIAKQLKQIGPHRNNFLFVAFSASAMGLLGSQHFVKNLPFGIDQVSYGLNLNKVGYLDALNQLTIEGTGTAYVWKEMLPRMNKGTLQLNLKESGVGNSDQNSFYIAKIPALTITTGPNEKHRTPDDDSEYLNYEGIRQISDFVVGLIQQMAPIPKLQFTPTLKENTNSAPRYKVTLGIRPDYNAASGGVLVESVTAGRPAEKAGIETGDFVIKMGDLEINTIYDYMKGLSQFNPGEAAIITIKRDGKTIEKKVTF